VGGCLRCACGWWLVPSCDSSRPVFKSCDSSLGWCCRVLCCG
jgi:hypothetical protein